MFECVFKFQGLDVEIAPDALETMLAHRQRGFFSSEAGGQMFARLSPGKWRIEVATGPRHGDRRGRFHFWPNRKAEQDEINSYFKQGLDFVGDWHTHPENRPHPSSDDYRSVANIVRESTHELPGMLMCIVGRENPPDGLWMSFHLRDGKVATVQYPDGAAPNKESYRRRKFI
ncbi:Mov34/MPN/PAD-1 family protein [Shinella zoogloeoides]|uniref:Mov34/MPN/PAD-1 family protein n=1 Tax=Shinella zoogloeoides TaxID=352475 RepID=UPI0028A61F67|nr:Mov34/MPN/PAD-1 family protein [Shinella zoogloeoides]